LKVKDDLEFEAKKRAWKNENTMHRYFFTQVPKYSVDTTTHL